MELGCSVAGLNIDGRQPKVKVRVWFDSLEIYDTGHHFVFDVYLAVNSLARFKQYFCHETRLFHAICLFPFRVQNVHCVLKCIFGLLAQSLESLINGLLFDIDIATPSLALPNHFDTVSKEVILELIILLLRELAQSQIILLIFFCTEFLEQLLRIGLDQIIAGIVVLGLPCPVVQVIHTCVSLDVFLAWRVILYWLFLGGT